MVSGSAGRGWALCWPRVHCRPASRVPYQLYNVRGQLRPAASLIGAALRAALTAQPDTSVPDAHAALHALREGLRLSDRDRAWAAILSATQGLTHTTWGALHWPCESTQRDPWRVAA